MNDFAILSLPRSGSHMLASALDSHPDIICTGEYEMIEKFPIGRGSGSIEGLIVQSYHISGGVAPEWLPEAKLILLQRPIPEILESLFCNSPSGTNYSQFLEPRPLLRTTYPVPDQRADYLAEQQEVLHEYVRDREYLAVTYQSLCRGADARTIRWEVGHMICDFLGVDRQVPLRPSTYKPS